MTDELSDNQMDGTRSMGREEVKCTQMYRYKTVKGGYRAMDIVADLGSCDRAS